MIDYEKMYRAVYSRRGALLALKILDRASVAFCVASYGALVTFCFLSDIMKGVLSVILTAVPFLLLSLFRRYLSAPRPYELIDFEALGAAPPRKKSGSSFPSRHVFCAFLIGVMLLVEWPLLAAPVLLFGVALGACRVLLGIHFIRDCAAGAVIGLVSGAVGLSIIYLLPLGA